MRERLRDIWRSLRKERGAFSKLKHGLRKASARNPDDICEAIRQILPTYSPEECANYFKNAGYDLT